ncbi:MAG: hypothetical protein V4556_00535 [Bacteroidota bacterium]
MNSNKNLLVFIIIITIIISSCRSSRTIGEGGKIVSGKVYTKCTKPQKRYTKSVEAAVKGSIKALDTTNNGSLSASLKTEVTRLTDYSQQGLDLDLLLFRLCEMSNNSSLSPDNTNKLFGEAMKTWNNRMTIKEQKNIIAQLQVELSSNLKTANELKLNCETILSALNMISGDDILRNAKIKILPLIFPKENLDKKTKLSVSDLVAQGLTKYLEQHLDTNQLEKAKFSAAGKAIALTLDKTLPTFNSLADKEGHRYPIYTTIWNANSQNLSKIDVFDITKFQQSYSDLNSLKTNYSIVINRSIDYLTELNNFFKPEKSLITKESLEKILTSERFSYDLIETYSKSLLENIKNITDLQKIVSESLL